MLDWVSIDGVVCEFVIVNQPLAGDSPTPLHIDLAARRVYVKRGLANPFRTLARTGKRYGFTILWQLPQRVPIRGKTETARAS